ncbi:MAG TPA: ATP-binding protein [Kiritimatiellia bacterium]|nr:ATP-binding protein [Kiritimatiellia bacterium]
MKIQTRLIAGFGAPLLLLWLLVALALAGGFSPALIIATAALATLAAAAGGVLTARAVLRPVRKLCDEVSRITGNEAEAGITPKGDDEMTDLARVIKVFADRLKQSQTAIEDNLKTQSRMVSEELQELQQKRRELEEGRRKMAQVMDNLRLKQAEMVEEVNQRKLAEARLKNRVAEVEVLNRGITNLLEDLQEANRLQAQTTRRLETANRELESFSYSVSHDLRAPLRAINGFADALVEEAGDNIPETCRHFLAVITRNARSMGQLIDDLLSLSRLGRKPLERLRVDMNTLVREVAAECRPDPAVRQVEFQVEPLPPAQADLVLIRQVWTNLISNAVKFTKNTEHAKIHIWSFKENGQTVYAIRDNGAGFNMDYVDQIFGVFQRLHRAEDFEGTGVGLAIVHRIIQRHGGTIRAEGRENEGAAFFFAIPED